MRIQGPDIRELLKQHFLKPIQYSDQFHAAHERQNLQFFIQVDRLQFYVLKEVFRCY